tara:strand:- start:2316 stop:2711 length:396 start_codon:yes stop_codon:yes gene_type:complete
MNISAIGSIISGVIKPVGDIIDDLTTSGEEKLDAKQKIAELLVSADQEAQREVTKRWESDTNSDSWLPKNIRPIALAFLTIMFVAISVFDGNIGQFIISEPYIPVYQTLLMVVYGSYFAGRSVEKIKKSGN